MELHRHSRNGLSPRPGVLAHTYRAEQGDKHSGCGTRAALQQGHGPALLYLADFQQVAVYSLLCACQPIFFAEVVRPQLGEVVVWVDVIQRQDEVDECLAAAANRGTQVRC